MEKNILGRNHRTTVNHRKFLEHFFKLIGVHFAYVELFSGWQQETKLEKKIVIGHK